MFFFKFSIQLTFYENVPKIAFFFYPFREKIHFFSTKIYQAIFCAFPSISAHSNYLNYALRFKHFEVLILFPKIIHFCHNGAGNIVPHAEYSPRNRGRLQSREVLLSQGTGKSRILHSDFH